MFPFVNRSSMCDTTGGGVQMIGIGWDTPVGVFMNLDEIYQNGVAFIAYKNAKKISPQATVFFVKYSLPTAEFVYAVTAAHCVNEAPDNVNLWYNDQDGRRRSIEAPKSEWLFHPEYDVAVVLVDPSLPVTQFPKEMLSPSSDPTYVHGGRLVVTVGLFEPQVDSLQPIARFGHIARPNIQAELRFRIGKRAKYHVHAIECMVWEGQSGSPVFCFDDRSEPGDQEYLRNHWRHSVTDRASDLNPRIIGLLHGYFPMNNGADGFHTGISIVIPSEYILETLELPEVQDGRGL